MYPNFTIIDNFLDDPDAAVELSKNLKWTSTSDGRWPGERSEKLHEVNKTFFNYVCNKIYNIFYESQPNYWNTSLNFQRIKPFHTDQYDKKNRGWIHMDDGCHFGGIIYLNKNPEPDTGTSMYRMKDGYSMQHSMSVKQNLYIGNMSSENDEQYYKTFDEVNGQYLETVKVENVYNRLVFIDSRTYHGVQTFGTKERLTLCFFGNDIGGKMQPMLRQSNCVK